MTVKVRDAKRKYAAALEMIAREGGKITKESDGPTAYIKGTVPTQSAKNRVWDVVKRIDPTYKDLTLDLDVTGEEDTSEESDSGLQGDEMLHHPAQPPTTLPTEYTVKPGDTLSKIARQFYGDPSEYEKIFDANRDELDDPNKIKPGQVLVIPDITV